MGFKVTTFKSLSRVTSLDDLKRIRENRNDEIPLLEKINFELRNAAKNPANPIEAFIPIEKYEKGELENVKRRLEKYGFVVSEKESIVNRNQPKIKYWLIETKENYDLQQRSNKESEDFRTGTPNHIVDNRNLVSLKNRDYPPRFPAARP